MPLTGTVIIGRLHKLYVEPDADIGANANWAEYGEIQGASRTQQRDQAEIKERSLEEATVELGHIVRTITLSVTRRPGLADTFDVLEAAFESGDSVGIAMVTGLINTNGERGYMAECKVVGWDDDQAHDGSVIAATLRPAAGYTVAPATFVVNTA